MLASAALLSLLALGVRAQSIPTSANASQLAIVDAEWVASGFPLATNAGFGLPLNSKAILTIEYASGFIVNGDALTPADAEELPAVFVTPSDDNAADFTSSTQYTLMLADASALGDPDVRGNYRHFLANSMTGAAGAAGNTTFQPVGGTVITAYATPGPIAGTGTHRYAWLLFTQGSSFSAPANLSTAGVAPGPWSVNSYVEETGIELVAASFFTVTNGDATGSVAATSAVNTAAIEASVAAAAGPTSSAAASTPAASSGAASSGAASSAGSSRAASSSAPAASARPSGSATRNAGSAVVALMGAAVALAF